MAKDPAMLWYWGDWHSGTSLYSRFLKGCYIDILHAQFNNGHLSIEEIKTCLGSDFGASWPAIQKKFKQDENGLFFNERLEHEKEKRQKFTESRRQSRLGIKNNVRKTYDEHTSRRMENENENINVLDKVNTVDVFPIEKCLEISLKDSRWVKAVDSSESELKTFNKLLEQSGIYDKNPLDYKNHFGNLKRKKPELFKNAISNISKAIEALKAAG